MTKNSAVSGISADYAQRIAEDLATNRTEQERVRAELTRLQAALVQLEESETILTKMQGVLGNTKPAAQSGKSRKEASVPAARRPKGKGAPLKESQTEESRTANPAAQAEENSPSEKNASPKGSGETTWRELVAGYLAGQREPKSSAEVTAALAESFPQRKVQVAVVRNTLEQGVAHGVLERSKQGRSVFYSPASAKEAEPGPDEASASVK